MVFKECDTCSTKPGSPTLCAGCYYNRETFNIINKEVQNIRQRLTKEFPELAFVGKGYTIKMLEDDLKGVLSLTG
jgi:hypothetical protein